MSYLSDEMASYVFFVLSLLFIVARLQVGRNSELGDWRNWSMSDSSDRCVISVVI